MSYKELDMNEYKRKKHFDYFRSLFYPYVGVTVNVDITELLAAIKAKKSPFFLSVHYCVANAANQIPEFRQRISGDGIVEYDYCRTSHTVALENGTYCYCTLDSRMPFPEYVTYAAGEQEKARQEKNVEDKDDVNELIFISTLPSLTYNTLIQPVPNPADSNPRITWGAYFTQDSKILLPVTVLCNHALVDGLHMSQFYKALESQIAALVSLL